MIFLLKEYGIANLRNKSIKERAEALIEISHPDFRDELTDSCHKIWGIHL